MAAGSTDPHTSLTARLVAVGIAFVCLALMVWIGREDVPVLRDVYASATGTSSVEASSTGNPELDACLKKRLGDVNQMVSEGIVSDAQADTFRSRAISYCETQFPAGN